MGDSQGCDAQTAIAQFFYGNIPAIKKHLKNIFNFGELNENSVPNLTMK